MLQRVLFLAILLTLLVFTAVLVVGYRSAPNRATGVAVEAANSLGLNLLAFAGPARSGSYIAGTESFHWERKVNGFAVEQVAYFPGEERLCWQQRAVTGWKDNGCINTRLYQY